MMGFAPLYPSYGLVDGFAQQLGGHVEWKSGRHGTTVQLVLPSP
jgi:hypothetical protein